MDANPSANIPTNPRRGGESNPKHLVPVNFKFGKDSQTINVAINLDEKIYDTIDTYGFGK